MSKIVVYFTNGETKIIEDAEDWCTGYLKSSGYTMEFNPTNYMSIFTKSNKEYLFPYSNILYAEFEKVSD